MYTIIGDPHAKPGNLDKINLLFDMVEELGNPVIWLGDMLDTKEVVRGKCLNTYIRRFRESKLQHYVLVGNHDWFNLECLEHSLEPLKSLKNVVVVEEAMKLDSMLLLPYTHDYETFKRWLAWAGESTVLCHADIQDFDYGNGLISTEGLHPSDLEGFRIISGHYHKYQEQGNITYLGTPFSHSFGESNQEKYIGIFRPGQKLELLKTPFPRHVTHTIDCSKHSMQKPLDEMNIVRVVLQGTQEEIDRFHRVEGVKYIEQPTAVVKMATIDETASPEAQFSKWAKDIKGYSNDILELGLEVLSDV